MSRVVDRDWKIRLILSGHHGLGRQSAMMALLRGGPDFIEKMYRKKLLNIRASKHIQARM